MTTPDGSRTERPARGAERRGPLLSAVALPLTALLILALGGSSAAAGPRHGQQWVTGWAARARSRAATSRGAAVPPETD
ncbi:hypothetical protein GCM10023405_09920 [Streptomonospora salina]